MSTKVTAGKKILCFLLSLAMLVCMMPTMAFAQGEPAQSVRTAEEFAKMEPDGNYILEADITVEQSYEGFGGTFDGNGHTITLNIQASGKNAGLFKTLVGGAVVENLTLEGSLTADGKNNVGAVAGMANTYAGAITIRNCKNSADISGHKGVGGIVGICTGTNNSLIISGCANEGDVTGSNTQVGGIAGNLEGGHIIENCYNRGNVAGFNNYAGILGRGAKGVSLSNCYTTGQITAYGESTNSGQAVVGGGTSSGEPCTVRNVYALAGTADVLTYATGISVDSSSGFKSEEEMKDSSFAGILGSGFMADSGSYPILSWEIPKAKVDFDVSPEEAVITIGGAEYTGDSQVSLPAGEYDYTVSLAGYVSQQGNITVAEQDGSLTATPSQVSVTLEEDSQAWSTVTFSLKPENMDFEVKDGEKTVEPVQENTYKLLRNHEYNYDASAEGHGSLKGVFSFSAETESKEISLKKITGIQIQGEYKTQYYVGDTLDTTGIELLVSYEDSSSETVSEGFEINGFDSSQPADNQTLTVEYNGVTATYDVTIEEKPFPSSVFNALAGKATVEYQSNSSFTGIAGEEFVDDDDEGALKSNSCGMANSEVIVKIKFNDSVENARLSFDYRVEGEGSYTVYDGLRINGGNKIGTTTGYVTHQMSVKGGDEVTLSYEKDPSGDSGADCVWLKNFKLEELHSLTFDTASDAQIYLTDSEGKTVSPSEDGVYVVSDGSYSYTITKFGYETASGTVTVDGQNLTQKVELVELQKYDVQFNTALPDGAESGDCEYIITCGNSIIYQGSEASLSLPAETYQYVINHPLCESAGGEFIIDTAGVEIENTLVRKTIFEDFFEDIKEIVSASNNQNGEAAATYGFEPAKDGEDKVLASNNKGVKSSTAAMTMELRKNSIIKFKYKVSTEASYDKLIISLNGKELKTESGVVDWQDFELTAEQGDKITIKYTKDSSGDRNDDTVYLKDFRAEAVYKASFTMSGDGSEAQLTVKDKNSQVMEASGENEYLLSDGNYSYTLTRFGYETIEGSFEISGTDKEISIPAMTAKPVHKLSFSVTPSDASVTVKHQSQGIMEAEGGVYTLPEGETFTYTVSKDGYITSSGSFSLTGDREISIELVYAGEPWDGTTISQPETDGSGTYLIGNGEELAWFAEKAGEHSSINGKLTANINLSNKTWEGFGEYDYNDASSGFNGILDGDGYTINGLSGDGGLVYCLGPDGKITNLTIAGEISGISNIGGIADTAKGTIENCYFSGVISNSSGSVSTGGIAGRAMSGSIIRSCASSADVNNTYAYYNSSLNVGGIAGYAYGIVDSCYFTGEITAREDRTNRHIGGIAGQLYSGGEIRNCYSIGTVGGPEDGIGAIAGGNQGTVSNTYFISGTGLKSVAENSGTNGAKEVDSAAMKTGRFAYDLGENFNQDTDNINQGYPVLKWQGGSEPEVPEFEQNIASDMAALFMKDMDRAKELAAEKLLVDIEVEKAGGLDYYRQWFGEDLTMEEIYRRCGIDIDDDGTMSPDNENKYQLKKQAELLLPEEGEHGTEISWSSSDEDIIDPGTGMVSLPQSGKAEVKLTAAVSMGGYSGKREFHFVVWSQEAINDQTLSEIKAEAEKTGTFIQPMQMYGQSNVKQAMEQYLGRNGFDDISVELLDSGRKVTPVDNKTYIDERGNIEYFKGTGTGYGTTYAIYDDVTFRLTLDGRQTEVKVRVHIGWDFDYVEELLDAAMEKVTWDTIKGSNDNASSEQEIGGWTHTVVEGKVTGDLTLPYALKDCTYAEIKWSSKDSDALYVTDNNDGYTYTATLERPALGMEDNDFVLKGAAVFKFWDDYTISEMTSLNGYQDPVESFKLFDLSVPANDSDQSEEISKALEKYPELIRDFVDKQQQVDLNAVTQDIQMPIPSALEDAGIMTDRYYQKVTMTSDNKDVLDFNGYHGVVYRPLPGEEDVQVNYTVTISDRRNNATLGEKTFTMTVKAMEQTEIDQAALWMNKICTEEVYWNGIKGSNSAKDNVTGDLKPFAEILNNNGSVEYVRGAINLTFGGAEVDDLPGYDPMNSQPWREFRSSRETVISSENLLVQKPEYNTDVTIDSVLTHNEYGKYWEKFSQDSRYAQFEQFYKRPVSVTVTVKGVNDMADPDAEDPVKVTVSVKGNGYEGFADINSYSYSSIVSDDKTAWDALEACLIANGYKIKGSGSYISAVTDVNNVTLEEVEHGPYSGWLYTVNGKMPDKMLNQTYLKDGDVIDFYYSDGKTVENELAAEEVEKLIEALPALEDITPAHEQQVIEARDAYNSLSSEQKNLISEENKERLKKAEDKIASLKQEIIASFEDAYKATGDYLQSAIKGKEMPGIEWAVLGLARAEREADFDKEVYYQNLVKALKENGSAKLSNTKSTENSRTVLALTAIGKDVKNVAGYNLLEPLADLDYLQKQGINGPIWALIAFDSHDYEIPKTTGGTQVTRENLIETILNAQLANGGFALTGEEADADMTAMAIQALAPYYDSDKAVKDAVDKALSCLSAIQNNDGSFSSKDINGVYVTNAESCAQVITALTALKIDPAKDARFIKNGHTVIEALLGFYVEGGGFAHEHGGELDDIATEQSYYSLASYSRFLSGKTTLYDMSDVKITQTTETGDNNGQSGGDESGGGGNNSPNTATQEDGKTGSSSSPEKTGDANLLLLWIITAASGATGAVLLKKRKKSDKAA
ncbi:MAG: immunoglobulin-like domain-containing protein [Anaerovoracaceae bacterium]